MSGSSGARERIRRLAGRKSLREFSWLSGNTQLEVALSLLSSVLLIRLLPEAVAGQVFFAQAAVGIAFMVLDPRLEDAVQRFYPMQRGSDGAATFFWRMARIDLIVAVGAVILGVLATRLSFLSDSAAANADYLVLALLAGGAAAAAGTLQAGFAVSGRLSELARWRSLMVIISTTLAIGGLLTLGPLGYLGGLAIGAVAFYVVLLIKCRAILPRPDGPAASMPAGVWPFAIKSSLATSLAAGGDNAITTVAGLAGGPDVVVLLKVAMAPGRFLLSLLSPVAAQLFPRLSEQAAVHSIDNVRALCQRATRWAAAPVALVVGVGWVLLPFALALVYGEQYRIAYVAAGLFLTGMGLRALVIWSKVLPLAVGRPGLRLAALGVEAAVLISASAVLPSLIPDQVRAVEGLAGVALILAAAACAFWLLLLRWPGLLHVQPADPDAPVDNAMVPKAGE